MAGLVDEVPTESRRVHGFFERFSFDLENAGL